jgi:hypothetical protein
VTPVSHLEGPRSGDARSPFSGRGFRPRPALRLPRRPRAQAIEPRSSIVNHPDSQRRADGTGCRSAAHRPVPCLPLGTPGDPSGLTDEHARGCHMVARRTASCNGPLRLWPATLPPSTPKIEYKQNMTPAS